MEIKMIEKIRQYKSLKELNRRQDRKARAKILVSGNRHQEQRGPTVPIWKSASSATGRQVL